jgi:hypothetical protein
MCVRVNVLFYKCSYVRKTNDFFIKSVCTKLSNHALCLESGLSATTIDSLHFVGRSKFLYIYFVDARYIIFLSNV